MGANQRRNKSSANLFPNFSGFLSFYLTAITTFVKLTGIRISYVLNGHGVSRRITSITVFYYLMTLALPGETRVLQVFLFQPGSLINLPPPPVTGALGAIGLSGRAS